MAADPSAKLEAVPDVDIDEGRFKYVLIKVYTPDESVSKHIVRGYSRAGFHDDVYQEVWPGISALGLECECEGGGRIIHEPAKRTIKVFGYSQGFGKADHALTTSILKKTYGNYTSITWTDDGY